MLRHNCVYEAVMDLASAGFSGANERFEIRNEEYPDGIKLDYAQVCAAAICKKGCECNPSSARCKMLKSWADAAHIMYHVDDNGSIVMTSPDEAGTQPKETIVYKRQLSEEE